MRYINTGDVGVMYRQPPHLCSRPKGTRPHPAMTVPGRIVLNDRPAGATSRSTCAYVSWEKGTLENSNRFVRRWCAPLVRSGGNDLCYNATCSGMCRCLW